MKKIYRGSEHKNWKGDSVGYAQLHNWIRQHKIEPNNCEKCKVKKVRTLDLANISGKYIRDIGDWEYLCRRCHMIKDGRMGNLKKGRKKKEYAACGRDIAARGICLQQYNYERSTGGTQRAKRIKPCPSCQ